MAVRGKKPAEAEEHKGVESNVKAIKFQEFLMDNDIKAFSAESLEDENNTVIFRSRIEVHGQMLPMAVLIDMSVFTMIRTQIVAGVAPEKHSRIAEFLNEQNAKYKIFKYYVREDGIIYLDICLPFVDETFDGKMIQLMLSILVQHLQECYEELMAKVWAK